MNDGRVLLTDFGKLALRQVVVQARNREGNSIPCSRRAAPLQELTQ